MNKSDVDSVWKEFKEKWMEAWMSDGDRPTTIIVTRKGSVSIKDVHIIGGYDRRIFFTIYGSEKQGFHDKVLYEEDKRQALERMWSKGRKREIAEIKDKIYSFLMERAFPLEIVSIRNNKTSSRRKYTTISNSVDPISSCIKGGGKSAFIYRLDNYGKRMQDGPDIEIGISDFFYDEVIAEFPEDQSMEWEVEDLQILEHLNQLQANLDRMHFTAYNSA